MTKKMKTKMLTFLAATLSFASIAAVSALTLNTEQAAAETSEMSFVEGASVRTTPDSMGIRFAANYNADIYARVEAGKEVGMIIVPKQAIATLSANEDLFDHLTGSGGDGDVDYGKNKSDVSTQFVQSQFTQNADGTYKAYGAIVGIQDENLSYEYQAVAYYVDDNGAYVYSPVSDTRSISKVTKAAIEDTEKVTGSKRSDVLKMASALSAQLKSVGKTATSEITFNTDGLKGLDLALYEVDDSFEIASAKLGNNAITVKDDGTVTFTGDNVSDDLQTLTLTYNDEAQTTLTFNVNAPKAVRTGAEVFEYSVFDYAAYEANGTYSFKTAAEPIFGTDYNQYTNQTPVSVKLDGKEILENGKLDFTNAYANNAYTNFGTEKTLVIDTDVSTWTYNSVGYTLVLTEVKHVQNWLKISYGLSSGGYSNGYFVLGNNITSEGVWTYTSDYAVKDADATTANSVCNDYVFAYNTASNTWRGFGGVFDGRGYYIDKMNIVANATSSKGQGFIPALTGTIKNVAFTNSVFTVSAAEWYGFVTTFNAGSVTDVYVDVELKNSTAKSIQPTFGVFTALGLNSNKTNITRCVAQVAYNTDASASQFSYGSSGIVAVRGEQFVSGKSTVIEDIFSITNLHANVSNSTLKATRKGGFKTATAMAAATANAYETNFVTNIANSVWTVDNQGLPYFKSMSATPYSY